MSDFLQDNSYDVQSVAFGADHIEITYMEARDTDRRTGITELRTLIIPVARVQEEAAELLDAAQQLIDRAGVVRRDPPQTVRARP